MTHWKRPHALCLARGARTLVALATVVAWASGSIVSAAPASFDPAVAAKFPKVAGWRGFYEVHVSGNPSKSVGKSTRDGSEESSSYASFELTRDMSSEDWDPSSGLFEWKGSGSVRVSNRVSKSYWDGNGGGEEVSEESEGTLPLKNVRFSIRLGNGSVTFHNGDGITTLPAIRRGVHVVRRYDHAQQAFVLDRESLDAKALHGALIPTLTVPVNRVLKPINYFAQVAGGPGPVAVNCDYEGPAHWLTLPGPVHTTEQLLLFPIYDDVECEVTIADYATWRPKGSIADSKKPGNALVARAVLKSKNGKSSDLPEVDRFRFELLDTSREPGVCLNWPLGAKDEDYDLRLADFASGSMTEKMAAVKTFFSNWGMASSGDYDLANMPAGGVPRISFPEVSENGQKGELPDPPKDKEGHPFAEAAIESFDFGAKSELRVTCVLKDGREIVGLMKMESGDTDLVRLPKRAGPDWVAESWRSEHGVMDLPANDDEEHVDGQDANGDGFTLYEEYRGWVENGKHIEGDPKRKELFVLNKIGPDAIGGFQLFQRESKVVVHHRLTGAEMSTTARLMNGNHRDAPHRVDQHGVWIFNAAGTGIPDAGTTGLTAEDAQRAFRPGRVRYITVEPRSLSSSTFSRAEGVQRYNLSERDASFGYDRAVAHELLHAVGVDHHGEGESAHFYFFQSASDPNNASHRAGFTTTFPHTSEVDLRKPPGYEYTGKELARFAPVTFLWEDTGRNVAEEMAPLFERALAAERARRAQNPPPAEEDAGRFAAKYPAYGKDEAYWRETSVFDSVAWSKAFELFVTTSNLGEADSGNEQCLMRYYFANAYPVKGKTDTYYLVRPGANRAGRSICRSPAGTGANDASHAPQPRFGDASPGRGSCFALICPNDAIPPRKL